MYGRCEKCQNYYFECDCINEKINSEIQNKIESIYVKYKNFPNELINTFEKFIEEIDMDRDANFLTVEIYGGYLCRNCALQMNAVPIKNYECEWKYGKCQFCREETNLCHTRDWHWPDIPQLEENG